MWYEPRVLRPFRPWLLVGRSLVVVSETAGGVSWLQEEAQVAETTMKAKRDVGESCSE